MGDSKRPGKPGRLLCSLIPAQDDPRRALVAPVGPRPVEHHHQPVAEADQEENVRGEPEPPRQRARQRSEEHTSELQSLMRISYAVFCMKTKYNTDMIINQIYNTSSI